MDKTNSTIVAATAVAGTLAALPDGRVCLIGRLYYGTCD